MYKNFDTISGDKFTTVDGREFIIKDYFNEKDFVSDKGDGLFVRHAALLRVTKRLFRVASYDVYSFQEPRKDNEWCSLIRATYVVHPKNTNTEAGQLVDSPNKYSWSAVADCNVSNSMTGFERYTTAVAETRASARALRNMLGLDVCSKEEISGEAELELPIQDNQRILLETKFIGEQKVSFEEMSKIISREITTLDNLNKSEAARLIEKLNGRRVKKKEG